MPPDPWWTILLAAGQGWSYLTGRVRLALALRLVRIDPKETTERIPLPVGLGRRPFENFRKSPFLMRTVCTHQHTIEVEVAVGQ
jgi:hypothetical protein